MQSLVRFFLLLGVLTIAAILLAVHGVRALALLMALAVAATIPQTRGWKLSERWLVRLTGSRQRAWAVALLFVVGVVAAVNIVELVR